MIVFKADFACKKYFLLIFFTVLSQLFFNNPVCAQVPSEVPDLPIDPNALKLAAPSDLQNYLRDYNQQSQKPGQDIHKELPDLNKKVIAKDSTQKDNYKSTLTSSQSVYGNNLFQNSQILELSQLST
ncbi:MAG TPA: hypothetical protein VIL78_16765, partial [Hanamia sp.]